jgi:hypothetical protein
VQLAVQYNCDLRCTQTIPAGGRTANEVKPRERVLAALRHEEPDRIPVDLGSCGPTAIHLNAYRSLLSYLGRDEEIGLWDVVGQLAQPTEQILEMAGAGALFPHLQHPFERQIAR